jgi:hypothetical protein
LRGCQVHGGILWRVFVVERWGCSR